MYLPVREREDLLIGFAGSDNCAFQPHVGQFKRLLDDEHTVRGPCDVVSWLEGVLKRELEISQAEGYCSW